MASVQWANGGSEPVHVQSDLLDQRGIRPHHHPLDGIPDQAHAEHKGQKAKSHRRLPSREWAPTVVGTWTPVKVPSGIDQRLRLRLCSEVLPLRGIVPERNREAQPDGREARRTDGLARGVVCKGVIAGGCVSTTPEAEGVRVRNANDVKLNVMFRTEKLGSSRESERELPGKMGIGLTFSAAHAVAFSVIARARTHRYQTTWRLRSTLAARP